MSSLQWVATLWVLPALPCGRASRGANKPVWYDWCHHKHHVEPVHNILLFLNTVFTLQMELQNLLDLWEERILPLVIEICLDFSLSHLDSPTNIPFEHCRQINFEYQIRSEIPAQQQRTLTKIQVIFWREHWFASAWLLAGQALSAGE